MNRAQWRLVAWLLPLAVVVVWWAIFGLPNRQQPPAPPGGTAAESYPHLRWGNPGGARENPNDEDNYLMKKKYFALSYNSKKGTPNWVSWRVARADLGDAPRAKTFYPDADLPAGFKVVMTQDYTGSGFDRGHMCPHGDRQSDEEASKATFVMTNIVPQSPANNRTGWEQFESYCRTLVSREGKELYIVAGPQGQGGVGEKGPASMLHGQDGPITVPAKTWKVVLVLDPGGRPDASTRLIAVVTPNDQTVDEHWSKYRTSVKAVEALTGYTFFDQADPNILGALKEKTDAAPVPPPVEHGR